MIKPPRDVRRTLPERKKNSAAFSVQIRLVFLDFIWLPTWTASVTVHLGAGGSIDHSFAYINLLAMWHSSMNLQPHTRLLTRAHCIIICDERLMNSDSRCHLMFMASALPRRFSNAFHIFSSQTQYRLLKKVQLLYIKQPVCYFHCFDLDFNLWTCKVLLLWFNSWWEIPGRFFCCVVLKVRMQWEFI